MTLQMTTAEARESGYAAYYDGYAAYCMDGLLTPDVLAAWRDGFKEARVEARGI